MPRGTDGLDHLADSLADTGARVYTIAADARDAESLGARLVVAYNEEGEPGIIM